MEKLMTGNEAVARGAYEAGVVFASAYPGTPSTEILENIAKFKQDIKAEWGPNEKVAVEACIGASIAGVRTLCAMKHVGVNVAADPLFTFSYTGVYGGFVIVSADEPGQHSSQTEQDNRNYAKFAKIALFEPSDSQEAKEMVGEALRVSEQYNTPVMIRMTTRVCHSKSMVKLCRRVEPPQIPYEKNIKKWMPVPAHAPALRAGIEQRLEKLRRYSEETPFNFVENHESTIGVIASGMCYYYAKEVFGDQANYLKLGFTNPLPSDKIKNFAASVSTLYIIEENDPFIEDHVRALGLSCIGKDLIPNRGELTPDVLRQSIGGQRLPASQPDPDMIVSRPPGLCAGCPHRGVFYALGKRKNTMVAGDIGCYSLGFAEPYRAMDFCICMGSGISCGHGAQQVFDRMGCDMRVVSVIGDSTFFHTGVNSLINVAYNNSNTITIIMDNRTTGMTGHQQNPGTGFTLQEDETLILDLEQLVRACGIQHVETVDPNDLAALDAALDRAYALNEPSVIITRWPCALKRFSAADREEFTGAFTQKYTVDSEECVGCMLCLKTGCPAIQVNCQTGRPEIDAAQCLGCSICSQVCPRHAIAGR